MADQQGAGKENTVLNSTGGAARIVADNPFAFAPSMALDAALPGYMNYCNRGPQVFIR